MTCYIVSFQGKALETRKKIREHLKTYDAYCPINVTCWAIVSKLKASEIRDKIKELLEPGDNVFVIRSGVEGAWRNVAGGSDASEWLKRNL